MTFNHRGSFDLQARLKDGADDKSYIRTLSLSSGRTGLRIRAVPYTDLRKTNTEDDNDGYVSISEFKSFMRDVNRTVIYRSGGRRFGDTFERWNLNTLKGIVILNSNPTSDTGTFTTEEQDHIENVIKASDDGRIWFDGRDLADKIHKEDKAGTYFFSSSSITPVQGWIVIAPYASLSDNGVAESADIDQDGYIDIALIKLSSEKKGIYNSNNSTITHELAHATLYPGGDNGGGHTARIDDDKSVIVKRATSNTEDCLKNCPIDRKAAKLIYESTFPVGTSYGEILGTSWHS